MFDEPVGALDRNLREQLMAEIRHILKASGIPAIYVTHDQQEAFALADRLLLLHDGRIIRDGTPEQIWNDPGSVWAARFLDTGNILPGIVTSVNGRMQVSTAAGMLDLECGHTHTVDEEINLLIKSGDQADCGGSVSGRAGCGFHQKAISHLDIPDFLSSSLGERMFWTCSRRDHCPENGPGVHQIFDSTDQFSSHPPVISILQMPVDRIWTGEIHDHFQGIQG
jgi:ABC-type sugar transport system ATPase subunit